MEFGIYTFGDLASGASDRARAQQRIDEIIAAARIADEGAIDVFGVGEHHRADFAVSSPSVVLGAIASVTRLFMQRPGSAIHHAGPDRRAIGN